MALFVLGDTHLSLGGSKPMDVFPGWNGYVERLEANWRKLVKPEDTIVLAGDISWAMRLTDTRRDFEFLQQLPGQKLIMKGNHDYWWTTANKMNAYLKAEGFDTLHILHNNSYSVEGYAICGTRGWLFDVGEPHDEKVMNREIGRLKMSLDAAEPGLEKLVFLHYPPVYTGTSAPEIVATLKPTASGPATTAICTAMPSAMRCRVMWTASATNLSALTVCGSAPTASTEAETRTAEMTKSQNLGWQFYHDRAIINCDAIVAPNLSARVPAFRKQQGRGARLQAAVFPLPQRNRIFEWRIHK